MAVNPNTINRLTLLFLRWTARVFPPPSLEEVTALNEQQLKEKYKWPERLGNFVVVPLLILVIGFILYFIFSGLASWRYSGFGNVAFMLYRPPAGELGIYAAFLAFFSGPLVGVYAMKLYLRDEFGEFLAYGSHFRIRAVENGQSIAIPVHALKVFWLLCLGTCLPLLFLVMLRIDTFTAFTDQGILDNDFFSFRTVLRPYAEVMGVYDVRGFHGRFEDFMNPYQVIVFKDGTTWETERSSGGPKLEQQRKAMDFVARQSGLLIQQVNFIEDIPGLKKS